MLAFRPSPVSSLSTESHTAALIGNSTKRQKDKFFWTEEQKISNKKNNMSLCLAVFFLPGALVWLSVEKKHEIKICVNLWEIKDEG